MDDYNISSADMAEMALAQAVDEHIDNSKETIDRISSLEDLIRGWNTEDIRVIKALVAEMRVLLQKHFQVQIENFINMEAIPSFKVPDQLRKTYRIIAADKKGYVLYGHEMDKIAHINKITEHYQKKVAAAKCREEKTKK
ncbi:MAG TPA: hypothetical protein VN372_02970 [Methanospirillum sp.]|nr:hypothetical protein [Methanospirillum sp.]